MLLWQLKAAQVVLLHCFSSKYVSTHSRVENVWVRLDWIRTQSFPQNPCTFSHTTAFWDGVQSTQGIPASWWAQKRSQLKERNLETLEEVFWQPQGPLSREVHMTKPALCYRSVMTHNSLQDNYWSKCCKNTQLKAQKMWFKCRKNPQMWGVEKEGRKTYYLKNQIPDPLLSTSAVL